MPNGQVAYCPHCGNTFPRFRRCGVFLPRRRAEVFDVVKAAGGPGIPVAEIGNALGMGRRTVKTHIALINSAIGESGWIIGSDGRGMHARRYLRRLRAHEV